uniref:Uncharacterized protein n=1 Tax=Anguilla anguilla TaxID=7936 RepID=A0A0E9W1L6_ANGAN
MQVTFRGEFWIQAQIHQNTIATEVHYSPRAELRIFYEQAKFRT